MKALITGASGFIGTHLSKALNEIGFQVYGIERKKLDDIHVLYEDIRGIDPDLIFHLAAYGNHSQQTAETKIIATNIITTYFLLEATKELKYKAFVNFGSSSEYGKKNSPMNEQDYPETDTFYGASKLASTYISRAYATKYKKPIVTVRPFSVYGPGEADFRFIPSVCRSILTREGISVVNEPKHDWIYIDDFIDGVLTVANKAKDLRGQTVNIGTGIQYSNEEVVKMLEKVANKPIWNDAMAMMYQERTYDNNCWVADNTKLKSLGWTPEHSLEQGLRETYKYYKSEYGEQRLEKKNN